MQPPAMTPYRDHGQLRWRVVAQTFWARHPAQQCTLQQSAANKVYRWPAKPYTVHFFAGCTVVIALSTHDGAKGAGVS
jgi:hypothetical protein